MTQPCKTSMLMGVVGAWWLAQGHLDSLGKNPRQPFLLYVSWNIATIMQSCIHWTSLKPNFMIHVRPVLRQVLPVSWLPCICVCITTSSTPGVSGISSIPFKWAHGISYQSISIIMANENCLIHQQQYQNIRHNISLKYIYAYCS